MQHNNSNKDGLCLLETKDSVTSISTMDFVPQPLAKKSHFIRNRIFVGNIPYTACHKDVNNAFNMYGKIIETNIVDSPNSTSRYGFVTFQNIAAADLVLRMYWQGIEFKIKGEPVTINHALFKPKKHCSNKCIETTTAQSLMLFGGRTVVTEFANGMAYFRPVKEEKISLPNLATLPTQRNFQPVFSGNSHFSAPRPCRFPVTLHHVPLYRYPILFPAQTCYNSNQSSQFQSLPLIPTAHNSSNCCGSLSVFRK